MRAGIAIVLVLAAASARADEMDRFVEACEAKDWFAAESAWRALPEGTRPLALAMKHADVLVHLGRAGAARSELEAVLEREPRNVVALATLAELRAEKDASSAKELLLEAAREGYPVLREIRARKELRALGDDPTFVLAAMRASSQFDARSEHARNPFLLVRAEAPRKEPVVIKVAKEDPSRRLAEYIRLGNEHLRAMVGLLHEEKLSEVSAHFLEVKSLCDSMRHETPADFARNADELERRAAKLDAEARRLQRIKDLGITVTGVVVAPSIKSRAIVALGREPGAIYDEGEELRGPDGARLRGLKVARIAEGAVSFTYEDAEGSSLSFVRELKRGP